MWARGVWRGCRGRLPPRRARHSGANDARQRCRPTCPSARRSALGSRDSSRPESDTRRLPSADGPASISPSGSTESSRTKFSMPKHITVAVPCMGAEAEVQGAELGCRGRDVRWRRPEMRADTPPDRRDRSTPDCDIVQVHYSRGNGAWRDAPTSAYAPGCSRRTRCCPPSSPPCLRP